jgi:hypothetical protein
VKRNAYWHEGVSEDPFSVEQAMKRKERKKEKQKKKKKKKGQKGCEPSIHGKGEWAGSSWARLRLSASGFVVRGR